MSHALARRGPDDSGTLQRGATGLAHRRLAIIDLSERAAQPMVDSELGLSVAYNGAIYNYADLRGELESLGYRFFSQGDTEVLLKAWHAWGPEGVRRLRGMFAFALADHASGELVLGRDPLGIKPLYTAEVDGALRFASSLPALVKAGGVDTSVDPVALAHYMSFHAVVPAPRTILQGVRKLHPGELVRVAADGAARRERHWQLNFDSDAEDRDRETWRRECLAALRTAVTRRLVADVPVGVLLSGGLDSSLVVALLAEAGQSGLETFSVGFESIDNETGDEFQWSDLVAETFGTKHHKLFVDPESTLDALPACVDAMSEPMVSHDAVGFYLLSQEVSQHVKVVQSGQGADEIFGGYHWYPPLLDCGDSVDSYAKVFFDRDHAELTRALHPRFHGPDHARDFVAREFATPGATRAVDQALRLDTTVMLVDDPVKRVDNMTMAFGLEARVPFLDQDLVELAARVPAKLKVAGGGKFILKEAARAVLPDEVIDRPKGYFPVPALRLLRGGFLALVRETLSSTEARGREVFQADYVADLLERPDDHITPLRGSKLWQVALLELWFQRHGISA